MAAAVMKDNNQNEPRILTQLFLFPLFFAEGHVVRVVYRKDAFTPERSHSEIEPVE